MGVSLISLGIVLLISLMGGSNIADQLMSLWPIILVMIGGEILFLLFRDKEGQEKVKYDVFSIIMIFIIFMFSMGIYSLSTTGLLKHLTAAVNSRDYTVSISRESAPLKENIRKVVITPPADTTLEITGTQEQEIVYQGIGEVFATSQDRAQELINEGEVTFEAIGEVLNVNFTSLERRSDMRQGVTRLTYHLALPKGVAVEIKGYGNHSYHYTNLVIDGDAIGGNWLVNGVRDVQVKSNTESDFILEAVSEPHHQLRGNMEWQIQQEDEEGYVSGQIIFGKGTHRLNIFKADVEVLQLH